MTRLHDSTARTGANELTTHSNRALQRRSPDPPSSKCASSKCSASLGSSTTSERSSACLFAARISWRRKAPTAIKKAAHTKKGGVNAARSVSTPLPSSGIADPAGVAEVHQVHRACFGQSPARPAPHQVRALSRVRRGPSGRAPGFGVAPGRRRLNSRRGHGPGRQPRIYQLTAAASPATRPASRYFLRATRRPNVEKVR